MHHPIFQDNTYHGLCYTSRGALAGTRNTARQEDGIIFIEKIKYATCANVMNLKMNLCIYLNMVETGKPDP